MNRNLNAFLKIVPLAPEENSRYCIERIYPPDKDCKVFVTLRMLNKSETFKIKVEDLNNKEWISKLSAQDAFKIGAFSNPNISKEILVDLIKKSKSVINNKSILLFFLFTLW